MTNFVSFLFCASTTNVKRKRAAVKSAFFIGANFIALAGVVTPRRKSKALRVAFTSALKRLEFLQDLPSGCKAWPRCLWRRLIRIGFRRCVGRVCGGSRVRGKGLRGRRFFAPLAGSRLPSLQVPFAL